MSAAADMVSFDGTETCRRAVEAPERYRELRERLGISSFMVGDVETLAPVVERLSGT